MSMRKRKKKNNVNPDNENEEAQWFDLKKINCHLERRKIILTGPRRQDYLANDDEKENDSDVLVEGW